MQGYVSHSHGWILTQSLGGKAYIMLLMWFVVSTDGQKPNVGNMKLFPVHTNNDISVLLTPGQVGCVNGVAEKLPTGVAPCLPCTSKPLYCCAPCPVSRTEERRKRLISCGFPLLSPSTAPPLPLHLPSPLPPPPPLLKGSLPRLSYTSRLRTQPYWYASRGP